MATKNCTNKSMRDIKRIVTNELTKGYTTEIKEKEKVIVPAVFNVGCGLDTESSQILSKLPNKKNRKTDEIVEGKQYVKECFCYCYQFSIGNNYFIYRFPEKLIRLLKTIEETVNEYNKQTGVNAVLKIWVANLAHEWSFLKHEINKYFNITKVFSKGERDVLLIKIGCIELCECIGLFGHSLANIADNWTTTKKLKGDLDYNLIRHSETPLTKQELAYCENDVIILSEMHEKIIQAYTQNNGCIKIPYTASGFVRNKLKIEINNDKKLTVSREWYNDHCIKNEKYKLNSNVEYLKKINKKLFFNEKTWYICRHYSYSGGLCGSNIKYVGKPLKNIICADLTSDYPAQINNKKFPEGKLKQINISEYENIVKSGKPYFALLLVATMQSKSSHATFSKHKIINDNILHFSEIYGESKGAIEYNGKIWHGENMVVMWNDVDLRAYKKIYKLNYEILELYTFDRYGLAPHWLRRCMNNDYIKKALLKKQGKQDTIEYRDSKRDVNTYYGVLATMAKDNFNSLDENLNFVAEHEKTFKEIVKETWLNPYIAFWVTSYAREILMNFISAFPDDIIQYDTDSLYFKDTATELINAINEYNENIKRINKYKFAKYENKEIFMSLGTWDIEEPCQEFLAMGAKKYIKRVDGELKTVIAGLPKNSIPKYIEQKAITKPLNFFNPLVKWVESNSNKIIIDNVYCNKFASVYHDTPYTSMVKITDYMGKTVNQNVGSYHAILPVDFTLSLSKDYIAYILEQIE